ncbi:hypothetical protein PF005_g8891 [Phytophthora fragariae]|uniref:Potassium channel domain-containing protein n=2 Tax=Phytophthora fragariae TaxID=53985 RepID=A0A6A3YF24_9STRA|nr:hypothetical protein PF005_g8891 [Phytophthora fragariae]KAE9314937.1 hypothetical protein PF001_g8032 [Phytophthora fragariae]
MLLVSPPPRKSRFQSDAACSTDHVYLKSRWVVTSLRHPALRVLCCVAHTLLCLHVGVSSPLLTSLKTPASFPVHGAIVRAATTGFTWQKLIFQGALSALLLLLLRSVAYPRLVQRQWNWEKSHRHATRTFSRLSSADGNGDTVQTDTRDQRGVLAVHTFTVGGGFATPAVRSQVWNIGTCHGSWTFVAATFPFCWATLMWVIRKLVQGSDVEEMVFPEYQREEWNSVRQLELQQALSTVLVALSCVKLLLTLDWALQDRECNRVFFGNWLSSVRRVYTTFPAMEIMVLRNQIPQDCVNSIRQSPRLLLLPLIAEMILCGVFLPPLIHGQVHLGEERFALPRATLEVLPACPRPLTMKSSHQACELQYSYPLEIVNMVVLVRLYWFARVVRNQLSKRVVAMTMSSRKDVPVDSLWWSFRVSFALRPLKVLLTLFVTLWVSTAAAVSIFERPFPSKLDGEDHALWLTLVTMTGVGYGDAYPITTGGRVAIVLGAVFGGLAFISLMTSEFLDSLKGTKQEHAVLSAMDSLKWERTVRAFAAQLIQAAWGLHNSKPNQRNKLSRRVTKAAHQFKRCRKRPPMHAGKASHALQINGLPDLVSNQVESWRVSRQVESNAVLDSLEHQVHKLENSLQALLH